MAVQRDISLQSFNSLAVPSCAEHFTVLEKAADLPQLLEIASHCNWTVRVLGEGSNVVLAEQLDGLLIQQRCRGIAIVEEDAQTVVVAVAAGENWHQFVQWCLQQGYYGLENLALIPGAVGAAPIQNIGAYGVEVGGFLRSVQARELATGKQRLLSRRDCEFDYRDSVFKGALRDRLIIEVVQLRLSKVPQAVYAYPPLAQWLEQQDITTPTPEQVFDAVVSVRRSRLPEPAQMPNAGSFFKNPRVNAKTMLRLLGSYLHLPHYRDESSAAPPDSYKLAAAWLIDYCGFTQRTDRAVRVHPQHALVLINPQRRAAQEILDLAGEIVAAVEAEFGLQLEQEPRSYGF